MFFFDHDLPRSVIRLASVESRQVIGTQQGVDSRKRFPMAGAERLAEFSSDTYSSDKYSDDCCAILLIDLIDAVKTVGRSIAPSKLTNFTLCRQHEARCEHP